MRTKTMGRTLIPTGLTIVLLHALPASAATPGFAFLEIPVGARAAALGGAWSTLVSGSEAMFANPASIEPVKGSELSASHGEFAQKLRHDAFAISGRAWGGGIGASVRALYSEPIEERDDVGNLIGSFGAHDLEFAVGYAARASDLRLGVTTQIVRERIANEATTTYALGLGTVWESSPTGIRLALSAQNLGPAAHYTIEDVQGEAVRLPAAIQGGISYEQGVGDRFQTRAAIETRFTRGRSGIGMVGVELTDMTGAALRIGFRTNDDASALSIGAGYQIAALRLDYAYVPYKLDLGDAHRFSLGASF